MFAKLTWQPSIRHRIELSHNWVDAREEKLTREPTAVALRPVGWALSRSGMVTSDVVHTTRLRATSAFGPLGNELTTSVQTINEDHASTLRTPLFLVQGQNDPRVKTSEAEQMIAAVKKNGTPVWYLLAKDEGHDFMNQQNVDFQFYATVRFIQEYLLK